MQTNGYKHMFHIPDGNVCCYYLCSKNLIILMSGEQNRASRLHLSLILFQSSLTYNVYCLFPQSAEDKWLWRFSDLSSLRFHFRSTHYLHVIIVHACISWYLCLDFWMCVTVCVRCEERCKWVTQITQYTSVCSNGFYSPIYYSMFDTHLSLTQRERESSLGLRSILLPQLCIYPSDCCWERKWTILKGFPTSAVLQRLLGD